MPRAGPDTGGSGASRPQPRGASTQSSRRSAAVPASGQPRAGVQGGSPGSGTGSEGRRRAGGGGFPGLRTLRSKRGCRGPGRRLPAPRRRGHGSSPGSEVLGWGRVLRSSRGGARRGGFQDALCTGPPPAPSLPPSSSSTLGSLGWDQGLQQPISGRPGARAPSRKPSPRWAGLGRRGGLIGWPPPSLRLIPGGATPSPAVKPAARSRRWEGAWPRKLGLASDWLHSLTTL